MINVIQNSIGALAKRLGIVKTNLQLWLGFTSSSWVGGELVVLDKSTNSNNAKLFTGKALEFNGNDAVSGFGNPNINLKSICFWVNLSTTSEQIFNLTSTHNITASSGVITLGGTWSNSNIYVNGLDTTAIGTTPTRVVITTDANILVNDLEFAKIGSDYGALTLADVQIYDAELSLADALIDYNNPNDLVFNKGGSIALSNLKGYYALSEGSGSIAYDSSGEGNNGTINGATYDDKQPTIPQLGMMDWAKSTPVSTEVTLIEAPNDLGKDILGNALRLRDGGFNLDGSGYGEVADDSTVNPTTAITVQCWIQSNTESNKGLVAKWTNAEKDYMLLKTTSKFKFYIGANNGESGTIPTSGWVNIAGTYDGANIKTYINGVLSTTTSTTGSIPNSTNILDIGRYNNSQYYSERIDEVMVYNRALSQKEIDNNYKIGLSKH